MDRREFIKKSGWTLLGLAAGGTLASCVVAGEKKRVSKAAKQYFSELGDKKFFFGDIHNHCNITYGYGDLKDAFEAARQQLDFVAVTPHAMWPDIDKVVADNPKLEWVFGFHKDAFERLRRGGWEQYVKMTGDYNKEGEFVTFLSYECHSMEHGDHVVLACNPDAPLTECTSIPDLKEKLRSQKVFVTPHHLGYLTGNRGYNWNAFKEDGQIPFVEIFSRHGLAETDQGDYPYIHTMGPSHYEGTALYGLEKGYRFGMIGSSDQHAGYPGSYGDGRMVVLAKSLDRHSLWEAMERRNVYCITGDKIRIDFRINDAIMGEVTKGNSRRIYLHVEGENYIDYVDLIKNGRCVARLGAPFNAVIPNENVIRTKVHVNFGWGRNEEYFKWQGKLHVTDGEITSATPCFRGAALTSPQPGKKEFETAVNCITGKDKKNVGFEIYTTKNPNTMTPAVQGILLDVMMPYNAKIVADVNGQRVGYSLAELLEGTKSYFMRGWSSEAIQFQRAAPESAFMVEHYMEDRAQRDTDYYYVRVRQLNGQWAWSSPVWVERV